MIHEDWFDLINNSFDSGFDENYIKKILINQGYLPLDVFETVNYVIERRKKKNSVFGVYKSNSVYVFLVIAIFVVVAFLIYFLFFNGKSSQENLYLNLDGGKLLELEKEQVVFFNSSKGDHRLVLNDFSENKLDLFIYSQVISLSLSLGEKKTVDVDSDNVSDFRLEFFGISNGKVLLFLSEAP